MTIHTTFPDAIVFPDGTIRLVTRAAKDLAYANTNIGRIFSISTANAVPDYLVFDPTIPQMFEDEGMSIKWERQPVSHYRSKRSTLLKAFGPGCTEDEFDHHRARFEGIGVEEYRRQSKMFQCYARFREQHHQIQEITELSKRQESLQHQQIDE